MLNEKIEFQAYVTNPTSSSPRLQPKLLTDHFKAGGYLVGIEQIMTIIAREFIFTEGQFDIEDGISPDLINDTIEILHRWTGFVDNENVKRTNSTRVRNWLNKYPNADGWLREYWEFQYKEVNKKKKVDTELWDALQKKWNLRLSLDLDYRATTFTYKNVIANALEEGPLKRRYLAVKKLEYVENRGYQPPGNSEKRFSYLFDYIKGRNDGTYMKIMKIVTAYLIKKESHPVGQNEVWIRNGELAGWYGLDDGKNGKGTFYPSSSLWRGKDIYTKYSLRGSFTKISVDSEYLQEFDYRLIELDEADIYKATHWILDDLGHVLENCWDIT